MLSGCAERGLPGASQSSDAAPAASASSATTTPTSKPPPLGGERSVQLELRGFGPVTVEVPVDATSTRPVLVALHAHDIRPERACSDWRRVSDGWPFVVCPFGVPARAGKNDPVTVGSAEYTAREIEAGLEAVRGRFASHADTSAIVFAGYSLGAKVGAGVVTRLGPKVTAAVFGEGGYDALTPGVTDGYARSGLRRALLLCSTRACELSFAPVGARFRKAGIEVRIVSAGGTRHPFEGEVVEVARRNWAWLVQGDQRFRAQESGESNP